MITSQLITRMSATPIEHCKTPAAGHKSTLTRRRVKQNTADLSSLPAVRAGGRVPLVSSPLRATPAPKIHEIAEKVLARATVITLVVVCWGIVANLPSFTASAHAKANADIQFLEDF